MADKHCRFRKYARRRDRMKGWNERLVMLYWRYYHQTHVPLQADGPW